METDDDRIKEHMITTLRAAMQRKGIKQEDLAKLIGGTRNQVAKWATQRPVPTLLLARVCRVLDLSTWYYLTGQKRQSGKLWSGEPFEHEQPTGAPEK